MLKSVSLFASLLAIPLACQCCLHATLFTGLQIVGVTLHFLDNVLLLYLPLKPAQSIFERLAFLYANLCQEIPPPNPPNGLFNDTGIISIQVPESCSFPRCKRNIGALPHLQGRFGPICAIEIQRTVYG